MKDSDSIVGSSKKANGRFIGKLSSKNSPHKSNGSPIRSKSSDGARAKVSKKMMGGTSSKTKNSETSDSKNRSPRKGKKESPELRPRRRASQTYFFKYQLAKNPLKAEEEDLKLALLASLQQCENGTSENKNKNFNSKKDKKSKSHPSSKESIHLSNEPKRPVGRPPKASISQTATGESQTKTPRKKVKNSLSGCNSVQSKIKKAKKVLQNKQASRAQGNAILGKYSALRKFPSNSNTSSKRQEGLLLSPAKIGDKSKSKSKFNSHYCNDLSTASSNTTSRNQYFMSYSPYTPLQKTEPPDEDYLNKYKPETEDFLTFICFRTTAPSQQFRPTIDMVTNGADDTNSTTTSNLATGNNRIIEKHASNDLTSLKHCTSSPSRSTNCPMNPDNYSPNNHRRPTRQSPRLASSNRKISENESLNHNMGISITAYDNSITYEEDMKRASIALEDMAQEINSLDDINNEVAQDSPDSKSSSPYKNNKHLVKGLMTREFAGAFADEETIFESISNHKL